MTTHHHTLRLGVLAFLAAATLPCVAAKTDVPERLRGDVVEGNCPAGQVNVSMYYALDPRQDGISYQKAPGPTVRCTDAAAELHLKPGDVVYLERDAKNVWVYGIAPPLVHRR